MQNMEQQMESNNCGQRLLQEQVLRDIRGICEGLWEEKMSRFGQLKHDEIQRMGKTLEDELY